METTVIINKKQLPLIERQEVEKIQKEIRILCQRIKYINTIKDMFEKWNDIELENVVIDKELYKENSDNYIGKGYIKNTKTPVYFRKSDIIKVLQYNPI